MASPRHASPRLVTLPTSPGQPGGTSAPQIPTLPSRSEMMARIRAQGTAPVASTGSRGGPMHTFGAIPTDGKPEGGRTFLGAAGGGTTQWGPVDQTGAPTGGSWASMVSGAPEPLPTSPGGAPGGGGMVASQGGPGVAGGRIPIGPPQVNIGHGGLGGAGGALPPLLRSSPGAGTGSVSMTPGIMPTNPGATGGVTGFGGLPTDITPENTLRGQRIGFDIQPGSVTDAFQQAFQSQMPLLQAQLDEQVRGLAQSTAAMGRTGSGLAERDFADIVARNQAQRESMLGNAILQGSLSDIPRDLDVQLAEREALMGERAREDMLARQAMQDASQRANLLAQAFEGNPTGAAQFASQMGMSGAQAFGNQAAHLTGQLAESGGAMGGIMGALGGAQPAQQSGGGGLSEILGGIMGGGSGSSGLPGVLLPSGPAAGGGVLPGIPGAGPAGGPITIPGISLPGGEILPPNTPASFDTVSPMVPMPSMPPPVPTRSGRDFNSLVS